MMKQRRLSINEFGEGSSVALEFFVMPRGWMMVFAVDNAPLKCWFSPNEHVEYGEEWKSPPWLFTHVLRILFSGKLDWMRSEFYHFSMVPLGSLSRNEDPLAGIIFRQ
jgi:hypothetical protein